MIGYNRTEEVGQGIAWGQGRAGHVLKKNLRISFTLPHKHPLNICECTRKLPIDSEILEDKVFAHTEMRLSLPWHQTRHVSAGLWPAAVSRDVYLAKRQSMSKMIRWRVAASDVSVPGNDGTRPDLSDGSRSENVGKLRHVQRRVPMWRGCHSTKRCSATKGNSNYRVSQKFFNTYLFSVWASSIALCPAG